MSDISETRLKFLDGYKFNTHFDMEGIQGLVVDEEKPIGEGTGPNPHRLLSVAVGHCLSSSLLFCLRKMRVEVNGLEAIIRTEVKRNSEGRLRVKMMDVQLRLNVNDRDRARITRCREIFENFCTVTQSVRNGIEVNVNVAE